MRTSKKPDVPVFAPEPLIAPPVTPLQIETLLDQTTTPAMMSLLFAPTVTTLIKQADMQLSPLCGFRDVTDPLDASPVPLDSDSVDLTDSPVVKMVPLVPLINRVTDHNKLITDQVSSEVSRKLQESVVVQIFMVDYYMKGELFQGLADELSKSGFIVQTQFSRACTSSVCGYNAVYTAKYHAGSIPEDVQKSYYAFLARAQQKPLNPNTWLNTSQVSNLLKHVQLPHVHVYSRDQFVRALYEDVARHQDVKRDYKMYVVNDAEMKYTSLHWTFISTCILDRNCPEARLCLKPVPFDVEIISFVSRRMQGHLQARLQSLPECHILPRQLPDDVTQIHQVWNILGGSGWQDAWDVPGVPEKRVMTQFLHNHFPDSAPACLDLDDLMDVLCQSMLAGRKVTFVYLADAVSSQEDPAWLVVRASPRKSTSSP